MISFFSVFFIKSKYFLKQIPPSENFVFHRLIYQSVILTTNTRVVCSTFSTNQCKNHTASKSSHRRDILENFAKFHRKKHVAESLFLQPQLATLLKLQCNFIEITLRYECSPIFSEFLFLRTPGWLLLYLLTSSIKIKSQFNRASWNTEQKERNFS